MFSSKHLLSVSLWDTPLCVVLRRPLTSRQPHWLAVVTAAPRGATSSPCSRDEMQRHRFIPNPLLPFHSESFSFYNMTAKTFLDVFFSLVHRHIVFYVLCNIFASSCPVVVLSVCAASCVSVVFCAALCYNVLFLCITPLNG